MPHEPRPHFHQLMPMLLPPPDVEMEGGGGGGGDTNWSSSATARTRMPVADLEAYFAGQLQRAGWTRFAGDAQGMVAWSAWNVRSEERWIGLLMVTGFERGERSLIVHMQGPPIRRDRSRATYGPHSRLPFWRRISFRF